MKGTALRYSRPLFLAPHSPQTPLHNIQDSLEERPDYPLESVGAIFKSSSRTAGYFAAAPPLRVVVVPLPPFIHRVRRRATLSCVSP